MAILENARQVVLFGLESRYVHEVIDILENAGIGIAACVRSDHDSEIAGTFASLQPKHAIEGCGLAVIVPLLTPGKRKLWLQEAEDMGLASSKPVQHSSAVISPTTVLGDGALVGPSAVIGAHVVAGIQFFANRVVSVGHDCRFGDYCTIGPAVTLCGGCNLDDGVYVGAGAVLVPKINVGRNAVIGAGSVVTRDVESGTVVVGNPARVIRRNITGYRDIGV